MQVAFLKVKEFMMVKFINLRSILQDFFTQPAEWVLKYLILKNKLTITSQNHGFVVIEKSLSKNIQITHKSLFDDTIEGIKLNISKWKRPAPDTIPWDTKASGLYMICTLSKHEAERDGYTDSLMLDHEGNVAEATGANVFFKDKDGILHTPIPDSFLDGITRRTVIEIAKSKNIKVVERKINPEELKNFSGCFLTGTAAEVTPVSKIANYDFKVCNTIIELSDSYQLVVRKKKAA